jgi:hypothetical protein
MIEIREKINQYARNGFLLKKEETKLNENVIKL